MHVSCVEPCVGVMKSNFQVEHLDKSTKDLPRGSLRATDPPFPPHVEHNKCSVFWVIGSILSPCDPRSQLRRHEDAASLASFSLSKFLDCTSLVLHFLLRANHIFNSHLPLLLSKYLLGTLVLSHTNWLSHVHVRTEH